MECDPSAPGSLISVWPSSRRTSGVAQVLLNADYFSCTPANGMFDGLSYLCGVKFISCSPTFILMGALIRDKRMSLNWEGDSMRCARVS